MRRFLVFLLMLMVLGTQAQATQTQQDPVPTLVPPTPLPFNADMSTTTQLTQSAIVRIRESSILNVGILANEPPFGEFTIRGTFSGFDADLANKIASTWGVNTNFVQVTRQPDRLESMLRDGSVDIIIAAQVHHRVSNAIMAFSDSYYIGQKSMLVRADDAAENPGDLAGRPVGVVLAMHAQEALQRWNALNGDTVEVVTYLTLDQAYVALIDGDIDGVVDSTHRLKQISSQQSESFRILEEPVEIEPYAIGFLAQDDALRDVLNRTLHYLTATGGMNEIQLVHFPGVPYDDIIVWPGLAEEPPRLADYTGELRAPEQSVLERVQAGGVLRIAGLYGVTAGSNAPPSEQNMDILHRRLIDEMVARWGVTVEYIPDSVGNTALDLVINGQADIAVGVEPHWERADQVDFTNYYVLHGNRLLVRESSEIDSFFDLGGETILVPFTQPEAASEAVAIAETVNAPIDISQQRESDLGFVMLNDGELDARAAFADSIRLLPHIRANPDAFKLTTRELREQGWYSPSYIDNQDYGPRLMVMAVPYNDRAFYLLLEYTMQELIREGTLQDWVTPLMLEADIPQYEVWPGPSFYAGLNLSGR
jgi:polar amino acid transport system substrate-binding protein